MSLDASQFLRGLESARKQQLAIVARAVDDYGYRVLSDAQALCPVDERDDPDAGELKLSGTTLPIQVDGEKIIKQISFNTDYAAAVHENLEAHHDVGQAKYLTTALEQNAPKLGPFIAGRMKANAE